MKVPGGILLTIIGVSIVGLIFDPNVHFSGIFAMPSLSDGQVIPDRQPGYRRRAQPGRAAKRAGAGDDGGL